MASSFRSTMRATIAVGAFGALAVFGTAGTAGAQAIDPPAFGSLGSITDLFIDEAAGNIGGSLESNLGSLAGMTGSATGSLDTASVTNLQATLVAGSSNGSAGSIGDLAAQVDPAGIDGSVSGSATGSQEGSTMLGTIPPGSIGEALESGSSGLADALG